MHYSNLVKSSGILAAILLLSVPAAFAQNFNMKVFDDSSSGKAVLVGDFKKSIQIAEVRVESGHAYQRMVAATNLCVVYTKTAKFAKADTYCEKALAYSAVADRQNDYGKFLDDEGAKISLQEIAENNYAVLKNIRRSKQLDVNL